MPFSYLENNFDRPKEGSLILLTSKKTVRDGDVVQANRFLGLYQSSSFDYYYKHDKRYKYGRFLHCMELLAVEKTYGMNEDMLEIQLDGVWFYRFFPRLDWCVQFFWKPWKLVGVEDLPLYVGWHTFPGFSAYLKGVV